MRPNLGLPGFQCEPTRLSMGAFNSSRPLPHRHRRVSIEPDGNPKPGDFMNRRSSQNRTNPEDEAQLNSRARHGSCLAAVGTRQRLPRSFIPYARICGDMRLKTSCQCELQSLACASRHQSPVRVLAAKNAKTPSAVVVEGTGRPLRSVSAHDGAKNWGPPSPANSPPPSAPQPKRRGDRN